MRVPLKKKSARMSRSEDFDLWLRTVDNLDRPLMKSEYKVITRLIDEGYEEHRLELFDRLHWLIEKKGQCSTCGDERCGCYLHQQSCSHIIENYMEEQERLGEHR